MTDCISEFPPHRCLDVGGAFGAYYDVFDDKIGIVLFHTKALRYHVSDEYLDDMRTAIHKCKNGPHVSQSMQDQRTMYALMMANCISSRLSLTPAGYRAVTVMPGGPRGYSFAGFVYVDYVKSPMYQLVPPRWSPEFVVAILPSLCDLPRAGSSSDCPS